MHYKNYKNASIMSLELHTLIRNMSKSQKRQFTMEAQKQGKDNQYLQIFHFLDKMDHYEYEKLVAQCQKVGIEQLAVLKVYLHQKVLDIWAKSILEEVDEERLITEMHINNARVYASLRHFNWALDELTKAFKIAESHQLYDLIIRIKKLETSYLMAYSFKDMTYENMCIIGEQIRKSQDEINLHNQLRIVSKKITFLNARLMPQDADIINGLGEEVERLSNLASDSFRNYLQQVYIKKEFDTLRKQNNSDHLYTIKIKNIWQQNPFFIKTDFLEYAEDMFRCIFLVASSPFIDLENHEQWLKEVDAIENLIENNKTNYKANTQRLLHITERLHMIRLFIYSRTKQYNDIIEQGKTWADNCLNITSKLPHQVAIIYLIALSYFKNKKYDTALVYLLKIMPNKYSIHVKNYSTNCIALYTLCHYELKNAKFLSLEIPKLRQFLNKYDTPETEVALLLLKLAEQLESKRYINKKRVLYQKYLLIFEQFEKDNLIFKAHLGICDWINSKISK